MNFNIAIAAFIFIVLCRAVILAASNKENYKPSKNILRNYLLAGNSLGNKTVINLLLSVSFGFNALFYQVWLGYAVGAWALVAQGAWALSYHLLSKYSSIIIKTNGLHDFLGMKYSNTTRIIAGIASVIGLIFLMGWETSIGKETLNELFSGNGEMMPAVAVNKATWMIIAIVFASLLFTIIGGFKGNAIADILLSIFKIFTVLLITFFVLKYFFTTNTLSGFMSFLFPPLNKMVANLGWLGLITNIILSLAWQFIETTTWQSVIAGKSTNEKEVSKNLTAGGWAVFIAPGIVGTLLGAGINGIAGVTQENILSKAILAIPAGQIVLLLCIFIVIITSIMTVVNGGFLGAGNTLILDIFYSKKRLNELDKSTENAKKILVQVKVGFLIIALLSVFGINLLLKKLSLNLFDVVYVLTISQLSLIGPVLFALHSKRQIKFGAWVAIAVSFIIGFLCVFIGSQYKVSLPWLVDGAATFTFLFSILITFIQHRLSYEKTNAIS